MENQLYHHGIKGMHWGVRRTPEQLGNYRNSVNNAGNIVRETGNIKRTVDKHRGRAKGEKAKFMSDEELKAAVKRMNMEQQYYELSDKQISRGHSYLTSTLELAGSALAVTSSALSIMLAIQQLKKG